MCTKSVTGQCSAVAIIVDVVLSAAVIARALGTVRGTFHLHMDDLHRIL